MKQPSPKLLILGVGNLYYGDEGVGIHFIHYLRRKYSFAAEVTLMDGGTLGWDLLATMAEYPQVLIIDAVAAVVGKIYRFGPHDIPEEVGYGKLSSHEWEIPDLLTAMELYGDLPEVTIIAIGVEPLGFQTADIGVRLSDAVRQRLEALETILLQELESCGLEPPVVVRDLPATTVFSAEDIICHA